MLRMHAWNALFDLQRLLAPGYALIQTSRHSLTNKRCLAPYLTTSNSEAVTLPDDDECVRPLTHVRARPKGLPHENLKKRRFPDIPPILFPKF